MNSHSRTIAALEGRAYDRTPVIPLIIQHTLEVAGIPHSVYSSNPQQMAGAQLKTLARYDLDGLHISSDNYVISEALGSKVVLPYDEPPRQQHACLADSADLSLLNRGFDPAATARMPVMLEATHIVRKQLGDTKFIKANCDCGPFTAAAALRGAQQLYLDLFDNTPFVLDLMEIAADAIVSYAIALAGAGAHAITYGESAGSLVSREAFEAYLLPANQRVIRRIKDATGLPVFFHMCGNVSHIVDLMARTGADCLEIDSDVDMEDAYQKTGRSVCLTGNVATISLLLQGSPQQVYTASEGCIQASRGRHLILSGGCEVPRHTPPRNMEAMVKAAHNLSFPG